MFVNVLLLLVASACRDGTAPLTATIAPPHLSITSLNPGGDVSPGTVASPGPAFLVTDANRTPVAHVRVNFLATGGELTGADSVTNSQGIARSGAWRIPTAAGTYRVTATIDSRGEPVSAMSVANVLPGKVVRLTWIDSVITIATQAHLHINFSAVDQYNNGVPGVKIQIAITQPDGTVANDTAVTNAGGVARFNTWVLGGAVGVNRMKATESGGVSAEYAVNAVEGSLVAARYELAQPVETFTPLASSISFDADGSFEIQVGELSGKGKYYATNNSNEIVLNYADDFLKKLYDTYGWSPYWSNVQPVGDERVLLGNKVLWILRCWSEDCYERTWTYQQVP